MAVAKKCATLGPARCLLTLLFLGVQVKKLKVAFFALVAKSIIPELVGPINTTTFGFFTRIHLLVQATFPALYEKSRQLKVAIV